MNADNRGATRITELDYDQIKQNLLAFYENQDHWKDYDFKATGLDVITSQLAYALHYAGFYGNMLGAESFLDSADLRSAIVSHAKALSYTPRSMTAASAVVDVVVEEGTGGSLPTTLTIDKGTVFDAVATENGFSRSVPFITTHPVTSVAETGEPHRFENLRIKQGVYKSYDWVVDARDVDQKFVLPHDQIDVSLLEIYVQEGNDDAKLTKFERATDTTLVNGASKVFYLEETEDGRFRVFFGDGVFGTPVGHGKVIRAVYFETLGADGNGYSDFTLKVVTGTNASPILVTAYTTITSQEVSGGGSPPEEKETIKFNAVRRNVSRGRAVSIEDWKTIIPENFPDVQSVRAWGGEDGDWPYDLPGRVYVTLNPVNGTALPKTRKSEILEALKRSFRIGCITPVIVDPEYLWLAVEVTLSVDRAQSLSGIETVKSLARDAILRYSNENLRRFDRSFEHSRFSRAIDDADVAIANNQLKLSLQVRTPALVGSKTDYEFDFQNAIVPGTVKTNVFTWENQSVRIAENGGALDVVDASSGVTLSRNAGTVDHESGMVKINPLQIQAADATREIRVTATPRDSNVSTRLNKIAAVDPGMIKINAVAV